MAARGVHRRKPERHQQKGGVGCRIDGARRQIEVVGDDKAADPRHPAIACARIDDHDARVGRAEVDHAGETDIATAEEIDRAGVVDGGHTEEIDPPARIERQRAIGERRKRYGVGAIVPIIEADIAGLERHIAATDRGNAAAGRAGGHAVGRVGHPGRQQGRRLELVIDQDRARHLQIDIAAEIERARERHGIEAAGGGVDRVGADERG